MGSVETLWRMGYRGRKLIDWCVERGMSGRELGEKLMPWGSARIRLMDWLLVAWTGSGGSGDECREVWEWLRAEGCAVRWVWVVGEQRVWAPWVCHERLVEWVLRGSGVVCPLGDQRMAICGACMRGEYERLMRMCKAGACSVEAIRAAMSEERLVSEWVRVMVGQYWGMAQQRGNEDVGEAEWEAWKVERDELMRRMFRLLWGGGDWRGLEWGGDAAARGYWVVWWQWWNEERVGAGRWTGRQFVVPRHEGVGGLSPVLVAFCRHHFNDWTEGECRRLVAEVLRGEVLRGEVLRGE